MARRDGASAPDTSTRAAIVGAARELFESVGYNATTVEQIRLLAGVSRASFYFYFADKKTLFLEVLDELNSDIEYLRVTFAESDSDIYRSIVFDMVGFFAMWSRYTTTFRDGFALVITDLDGQRVMREMRERRYTQLSHGQAGATVETASYPPQERVMVPMMVGALITNFVIRFFAQPDIANRSNTEFEDAVLAVSEAWYRIAYGEKSPRSVGREEITNHLRKVETFLDATEAKRLASLKVPAQPPAK